MSHDRTMRLSERVARIARDELPPACAAAASAIEQAQVAVNAAAARCVAGDSFSATEMQDLLTHYMTTLNAITHQNHVVKEYMDLSSKYFNEMTAIAKHSSAELDRMRRRFRPR